MKSAKITNMEKFEELTASELTSVEGGLLWHVIGHFMVEAISDAAQGKGVSLADMIEMTKK